MITTSNQYKQYISRKAGSFHYVAEIKVNLESGDSLSFTEKDIAYNGISISDSTSSSGNFDIGAAIMKSCQIVLKDINGTLTQYDFNRATLNLKIGIESNDKTFTEWIPKGNFVVDSSEEGNGNVTLSCYDFLYYLDKSYSTSKLEYPATLRQIVEDCCLNCGLILSTAEFANSDFMVYTRPDDEATTYRTVLSWAAQLVCKYVKCDTDGRISLNWYQSPQEQQDFTLSDLSSVTADVDDVVITGVKVVTDDNEVLSGNTGYVLSVENNGLVTSDNINQASTFLANQLIGFKFRPFSASHISDLSIEAGDTVKIVARKSTYYSVITSTDFSVGSYQSSSCEAESPAKNSSTQYSASTVAYANIRKAVKEEKTARELAIDALNQALAESSGMYSTYETQADGSTITYLHDKPTLEESKNVIKISAEAIGVSNDGGKTYPYGLQLDGTLIAKLLYTVGINADYINTGALSVKDDNGETIFLADINGKRVIINGDYVQIGGKSLSDALTDSTNMTMLLSNEYIGIPADYEGNVTVDLASSSDYATTITVYYGSSDVTEQSSITVKTSAGITGTLSGTQYAITNITTDTAWVDIVGIYLNTLKITKRLNVAKIKNGSPGETGESALTLTIISSNGDIFKNGEVRTTLVAIVRSGSVDVTDEYDSNAFIWTRVSADSESDEKWNQEHAGGTKTIDVTADDVYGRATFFCDLVDTTTRKSLL